MAKTQVNGLNIEGRRQPLPIGREKWGLHGPIQTRWVNFHVYYVLPLGALVITLLVLFAVDAFDQPEKIVMVPVPTTSRASSQIGGPSTMEGPTEMTVGTIKSALAETEQIITSANKIAEKIRPAISVPASVAATPPQTPKIEKAESSPSAPPTPAVRIWDSPTNR